MLRLALAHFVLASPGLADDLLFFHSPSGNIACMIATGASAELRCDMFEIAAPIPAPPADCDLDYGHAFGIGLSDVKSYRICAGDTVADPNAPTLNYGEEIGLGGFRCISEKTGMTCTNPGGHGFILSKARQKLF